MQLVIDRTWDGESARPEERTVVLLTWSAAGLDITVDAPFWGDPAPAIPAGPCPGLWDFEVVELFVLGADERYTEIELGPQGHHLLIQLQGCRNPVSTELPLDFRAQIHGTRWEGRARVSWDLLPERPFRGNAYAIHGAGARRRYLCWTPVPGDQPDFHRLECFADLVVPRGL